MAHEVVYVTINAPTVESIPTTVGGSPTNVVDVDVDDTASNTAAISSLTTRVTDVEADINAIGSSLDTGVGSWQDLELIAPFIASPGLQHPQWRPEGAAGRFRGHYQSTSGTSTLSFARLPPGFRSAYIRHLFVGVGQDAGGVHRVARWDISNGHGTLESFAQYSVNHTFPMTMNTRFLADRPWVTTPSSYGIGILASNWFTYGAPWSVPSDSLQNGRILMAGLARLGNTGAWPIYRWDYDSIFSDFRAAGGTWTLTGADSVGPVRFDAQSTVSRLDYGDVTNNAWLTVDGLEWVSNNINAAWTAPTLLNSWGNFGGGYAPAGHTMFGDCVYMRGLVSLGTAGAPIFVLPEGRRPPAKMIFPVHNGGSVIRRLSVDVDGTVRQETGHNGNVWVSLCANFSVTP